MNDDCLPSFGINFHLKLNYLHLFSFVHELHASEKDLF